MASLKFKSKKSFLYVNYINLRSLVFNPPNALDVIRVAEKICVEFKDDMEWKKFGMVLLGTKDDRELTLIQQNNQGKSFKEKCGDLLEIWMKRSNSNPNWKQVIQALKEVDLNHIAAELETAIVSKKLNSSFTNIDEHHTRDDQVDKQGLEKGKII